jgi:hypothetical protein
MKLDQQYIERADGVQYEQRMGIHLYGFIGLQTMPEGDSFGGFLARQGVSIAERVIPNVGTWEEPARELHYIHPEQGVHYAYVFTSRPDIDVWSQQVYVFSRQVPDAQLAETITMIKRQAKDFEQMEREHWREVDAAYPKYWRMINYNWPMSILAYHLVKHGWTPQIETMIQQLGAYDTSEGVGLENTLIQSLLQYGQLIMAQDDPQHYIHDLLDQAGSSGRPYRKLV